MKFKINVGEFETMAEHEAERPQISDDVLRKYVEAIGDTDAPTGQFHQERKAAFEQMLERAKGYVESNGGTLEGESDDIRGFLKYTTPAIVHSDTEDGVCKDFWGAVFSEYKNYSISAQDGLVEICIYEEYYA